MDIPTVAGVVGTAVTLVATYHVAARQGAFRNARYAVGVGPPDAGRKLTEWPFAILIALPPIPADRYLFAIPVSLAHASGPGLSDVRCQVLMPREYSLEKIEGADLRQLELMDDTKDQRKQTIADEAWVTDFKVAHLRPDEHYIMAALASVECWTEIANATKSASALGEGAVSELLLTLGVFSPQHKSQARRTRVLLVRTSQGELTHRDIASIVHKSILRRRERVLIGRMWLSRRFRIPVSQYRCLVVIPSVYKFSKTTAIEGTLCGGETSRYEWVTVALFPDDVRPRG